VKRFIAYLVPIIILVLFFVVMNAGIYLKQSINETDHHFLKYHKEIKRKVEEGNWEEAMKYADRLDNVWKKKIPIIQFSVERDQINGIDISLARLRGYIKAEDKAGCFAELYETEEHWNDLGH